MTLIGLNSMCPAGVDDAVHKRVAAPHVGTGVLRRIRVGSGGHRQLGIVDQQGQRIAVNGDSVRGVLLRRGHRAVVLELHVAVRPVAVGAAVSLDHQGAVEGSALDGDCPPVPACPGAGVRMTYALRPLPAAPHVAEARVAEEDHASRADGTGRAGRWNLLVRSCRCSANRRTLRTPGRRRRPFRGWSMRSRSNPGRSGRRRCSSACCCRPVTTLRCAGLQTGNVPVEGRVDRRTAREPASGARRTRPGRPGTRSGPRE